MMLGAALAPSFIQASGTLFAALAVGVAGGLISAYYSGERDRQDKESQWRSHAIELTKLDLQRQLWTREHRERAGSGVEGAAMDGEPLRPSILDFLANYRDLHELGTRTPAELYDKILRDRIERPPSDTTRSA
jgi:hypothetical protein